MQSDKSDLPQPRPSQLRLINFLIFLATEGGALSGIDIRTLKPILNEAEGFYQIGPRDKCTEHYVLSVTIAFATNLPQVRIFDEYKL